MSPGDGGCQTATPPPYYSITTTYAITGSYTTKAPHQNSGCQTCYTESPKYNSALSYITREPEYYTEASQYYNTEALKYYTTTYAAPSYYTYVPKCYCA
jgi:hypothetical protein